MRFDVNLSILFTELPLLERPAAARAAGFDAVELWWPFAGPEPADREVDALLRALGDAGVHLAGLNFDAGDMAAGDRGLLSRPDDSGRFRANIDVAVGIAEATGCRVLNALYGNRVPGLDPHAQDDLAATNLGLAAEAARRCDATVVVEALNSHENPGYPLTSTDTALAVIDRVRDQAGTGNVAFLADLYHLARMGEDPIAVIERHAASFGHVQIADVPGRGRPGTGDLPYGDVFAALDASGYPGFVGLEYRPDGPSADSFGWLPSKENA
ncbi:hydroxypyruvate isomerase family protein [Actinoallomurus iriomotensis]|uniref:Hydroxypyruvate isomerase n=1 Tax=Actinoallomurus iriomotensis TaxID=478107 RepID=A0A9W6VRG8_9ACTN|nr:TIM barrel protein [Actinoallomurus iriomotensis]GLY76507.1 putative hydroxypyruvate isomerase [Actinoallomurus iriomotensis]